MNLALNKKNSSRLKLRYYYNLGKNEYKTSTYTSTTLYLFIKLNIKLLFSAETYGR